MATIAFGAGLAPAGTSRAGFGSPATSNAPGAAQLGSGHLIDSLTRDYVDDGTGNRKLTTTVQQLMYLAINTVRGSSVVAGLGLALPPDRIRRDFVRELTDAITQATQHIVAAGLVQIVSVEVSQDPSIRTRIRRFVRWRDLTTQDEHLSEV